MDTQDSGKRLIFQDWTEAVLIPFCRLLARRKATGFFLLFILTGCLLAYGTFPLRLAILLFSGCTAAAVLLLFPKKRFWYAVFLPVLAGMLLGSLSSLLLFDWYAGRYTALAQQEAVVSIRAEVTETVYTNAYSGRYICRVSGDGLPYSVVVESDTPDFQTGQVLTGEIRFRRWEDTDDDFEEDRYYLAKSVIAAAEDISLRDTGELQWHLTGLFERWNRYLSDRISAHVRNDGLPLAMLLGNRDKLSDTVQRDFRRLGILHLIAVSGTHFSMLASMSERLMIRFRIRPVHRCWLLGILTVLYMLLTGMTASVRRAGLMFLITLLCKGLELRVQYFSALNIACGLILLFDPFAVLDMGLHLSYLAVCGCILTIRLEQEMPAYRKLWKTPVRLDKNGKRIPPVRGWRRTLSPRNLAHQAVSMLLLNLVITCLTLPLSWLYFGEMSLASLLVNLFYIPATGVLLFLTLAYLIVYPLGFLIVPMAGLLSAYTAFLEMPAAILSALPHISVSLLYPFIPFFLIPMVLSVCLLPFIKHKIRGLAVSMSLLLLMTGSIPVYEAIMADETILVYRNDRVKDGFAIRSAGEVLLIDISDGSYNFTRQLLAEAKKLYATELGGYMITHYHNRHVGTFQSLTDNWIVRKLYLPEPLTEEETAVFNSLINVAADKGIETITFPQETSFGDLALTVCQRTYLSRSTHPVTGLILSAAGETVVYGSSSFSQGDPAIQLSLTEADIGILGAHSPVTKKTFALSFIQQPKALIWNGDSVSFYEGNFPAAELDLFECTRFRYRFPDATAPAAAGYTEGSRSETP